MQWDDSLFLFFSFELTLHPSFFPSLPPSLPSRY